MIEKCQLLLDAVSASIAESCPNHSVAFGMKSKSLMNKLSMVSKANQAKMRHKLVCEIQLKMGWGSLPNEKQLKDFASTVSVGECLQLLRVKMDKALPECVMNEEIRERLRDLVNTQ